MPIIVDGHNLLRAVQKIDEQFYQLSEPALCRIISEYLQLVKDSGEVIFDGSGPPEKGGFYKNLEIFFAGYASDADTIIENKIKASTAPKRLVVVSSDRRLRKAASVRKAAAVKSEMFWNEVIAAFGRRDKKKAAAEPSQKFKGLSESETKQWLKLFGLDDEGQ